MRKRFILPLIAAHVVLSSAAAHAQSAPEKAARQAAQRAEAKVISGQSNCPVGFSVRRSPGGELRYTSRADALGLSYQFSFRPLLRPGVAGARVLVKGYNGAHLQTAGATDPTAAQADAPGRRASEQLTLVPLRHEAGLFQTTAVLHKLTAVETVDLQEVTYDDGSTWKAPFSEACQVAPGGFLPVAASR